MYYIRIFDINHNILDELSQYNTLASSVTLNALSKCTFNVPLNSIKNTARNFLPFNLIEVWDNTFTYILYWGTIAFAVPNASVLNVSCYGYLYLLQKTYAIGETITSNSIQNVMVNEVANFNTTSLRTGSPRPKLVQNHVETNTLMLSNVVYSDDNYYSRITNICTAFNYDFDIDSNFNFNYYLRKGSNKPWFTINSGTVADNVVGDPSYTQDTSNMANAIIYNGVLTAQDLVSQSIYGKIGAPTTVSSTGLSATDMTNAIYGELQRLAYPSVGIQCGVIDSSQCPLSGVNAIGIGDSVTVNLPAFWGFNALMRIIEIDTDYMTGIRTITFGNILYRNQPPQTKLYV